MYHVIICDDEYNVCAELENDIERYFKEHFLKGTIEVFFDGNILYNYLRRSDAIDLLFLDIEFPKSNGVEVGKYLREEQGNESVEIIYISSKTNYAMELFQCRPLDFLVKPINYTMVKKIMDVVVKRDRVTKRKVSFKTDKGKRIFLTKDVLYFRSDNKTIFIATLSGESYSFKAKLDDIESQVPSDLFWRIHKSYLINHAYVQCYGNDWVEMINGDRLSISKSYKTIVRQKLMHDEF